MNGFIIFFSTNFLFSIINTISSYEFSNKALQITISTQSNYLLDLSSRILKKNISFSFINENQGELDFLEINVIKPKIHKFSNDKLTFYPKKHIMFNDGENLFLSVDSMYYVKFFEENRKEIITFIELFAQNTIDYNFNYNCLDFEKFDNGNFIIDCNVNKLHKKFDFLEKYSEFIIIHIHKDIYEGLSIEIKQRIKYELSEYLMDETHCQRNLIFSSSIMFQYCKSNNYSLKDRNNVLIWQVSIIENNEYLINFLSFFKSNNSILENMKVQKILINPFNKQRILILDYFSGIYELYFTDFSFKLERNITLKNDKNTFYTNMDIHCSKIMSISDIYCSLFLISSKYAAEISLLNNSVLQFFHFLHQEIYISDFFITKNYFIAMVNNTTNRTNIHIFSLDPKRLLSFYIFPPQEVEKFYFFQININDNHIYGVGKDSQNIYRYFASDFILNISCCKGNYNERIKVNPLQIHAFSNGIQFYRKYLTVTINPLNFFKISTLNFIPPFNFNNPYFKIPLNSLFIGPNLKFYHLSRNKKYLSLEIEEETDIQILEKNNSFGEVIKILEINLIESINEIVISYEIIQNGNIFFLLERCLNSTFKSIDECNVELKLKIDNFVDFSKTFLVKHNYHFSKNLLIHELNSNRIIMIKLIKQEQTIIKFRKNYTRIFFELDYIFCIPYNNQSIDIFYFSNKTELKDLTFLIQINRSFIDFNEFHVSELNFKLLKNGILFINNKNIFLHLLLINNFENDNGLPFSFFKLKNTISLDKTIMDFFILKSMRIVFIYESEIVEYFINDFYKLERQRNYPVYKYKMKSIPKSFQNSNHLFIEAVNRENQSKILLYNPEKQSINLLNSEISFDIDLSKIRFMSVKQNFLNNENIAIISYFYFNNKIQFILKFKTIYLEPKLIGKFNASNSNFRNKNKIAEFCENISSFNHFSQKYEVYSVNLKMDYSNYKLSIGKEFENNFTKNNILKVNSNDNFILLNKNHLIFNGPIMDYKLSFNESKFTDLVLGPPLEKNFIYSSYFDTFNIHGIITDIIIHKNLFFIISNKELKIIDKKNIKNVIESFKLESNSEEKFCHLGHHPNKYIFFIICNNNFKFYLFSYSYDENIFKILKNETINGPILEKIYKIKCLNNFIFIVGKVYSTITQTKFFILEYSNDFDNKLNISLIMDFVSEDFERVSINYRGFDVIFLNQKVNYERFILTISEPEEVIFLHFYLSKNDKNETIFENSSYIFLSSNYINDLVSYNFLKNSSIKIYQNSIKLNVLIGTINHLYEQEIEIEFSENKNLKKVNHLVKSNTFLKYFQCEIPNVEPFQFENFIIRLCIINEIPKDKFCIFSNPFKSYYLQIYKKEPNNSQFHAFKIIRRVFNLKFPVKFMFYFANSKFHLITSSYVHFFIDYVYNSAIKINVFQNKELISKLLKNQDNLVINFTLIASNNFDQAKINYQIQFLGGLNEKNFVYIYILISCFAVIIFLIVLLFKFHHRKKTKNLDNCLCLTKEISNFYAKKNPNLSLIDRRKSYNI